MSSSTYNLDLAFQPVVDSASGEIDHHEIIGRFPGLLGNGMGSTRFEGETDGDLGAALDLALGQGIVTLLQGRPQDRLLLPISWRSCSQELFRTEFERLLGIEPSVRRRMILEFVAADDVIGVEEAANYMLELRRQGCQICLSHFGSGAAGDRFLRMVEVDYIKFDEAFMSAAQTSAQERLRLRDIAQTFRDLDYKTIATGIDDARMADLAARAGITLGQGAFYGVPQETLVSSGFPVILSGGMSSPARTPFFLN